MNSRRGLVLLGAMQAPPLRVNGRPISFQRRRGTRIRPPETGPGYVGESVIRLAHQALLAGSRQYVALSLVGELAADVGVGRTWPSPVCSGPGREARAVDGQAGWQPGLSPQMSGHRRPKDPAAPGALLGWPRGGGSRRGPGWGRVQQRVVKNSRAENAGGGVLLPSAAGMPGTRRRCREPPHSWL